MKEKYIKAFINKNEINKKQFSITGILLGPILLLYKKMFISSFILLILVGITAYFNLELAILLELMIHLIIGFKYNEMYLNHVNKKIDEILISNSDKEEKELLNICKRKGKPFTPIIIFIGIIGIGSITLIPLLLKKEKKPIIGTQVLNNLTYTIPNAYQLGKNQSNNYHHYYHIDNNNNCEITITTHKNKKIDQLLNNSSKETIQMNQNSFIHQYKDSTDYYLIENNNVIYKIQFIMKKDTTCQSEKEEFLSSLSFQ